MAEARLSGDPLTVSFAGAVAFVVYLSRREVENARQVLESLVWSQEGRESLHLTVPLEVVEGALQVREGAVEPGLARMRRSIEEWRATGTTVAAPAMLRLMLEVCLETGQTEMGLRAADEMLDIVERGPRGYEAGAYHLKGELLLQRGADGDEEGAETWFRRALEVARRQEAKLWELRAATSLAHLWQRQGKRQEAHDLLAPVYAWFTEGFETRDLKDARALLDALAAVGKA